MSSNSPDSQQNKAISQRQYRGKEVEGFVELQLVIREVTGGRDVPVKRHETLTKAAQKIRELKHQNDELRRQLSIMIPDPSRGALGGQVPGAGPGGATVNPYAPGFSAWEIDSSTAQYPAQPYFDNAEVSEFNLPHGYPEQGSGI
ncbi:uncharacterized protein EDB91DRAFT_1334581 [Suillus paluster]|uniref:uncharacterized protein n=1 Tax=Suillus paluster TaxID=48578 RepID=UPI001B87DDF4|nr:uncharacterized protein EDB91DRAFT_1334581 [Suillus paluster]KAG1748327.1 hypothetical protein EDB91DRAFT_1334581 [Suillus paluster]